MANENPLEKLHEELDETAEQKRKREEREAKAAADAEKEKHGEELRAIDTKVTKLCEDVESWKTQTFSAIEKMAEQFQESTQAALREARETPQPVEPQNPPAPAPVPVEPQNPPPSDADDPPAAKTEHGKAKGKKMRFL